jgi:fumarate hydratase, class I
MKTVHVRGEHITASVADALQFISYTHPRSFIRHLSAAWERERSAPAKAAIAQILVNSRMALLGRRPICQDTGIVNVFLGIGRSVRIKGSSSLQQVVDEGVRRAYRNGDNPLRPSIVASPLFERVNTGDNTPAAVHVEIVERDDIEITVAAKGGGSENKARFAVLLPNDDVASWVVDTVSQLGAGWCPPGLLGIGVGGTAEQAMLIAKQALTDPIDMNELLARGAVTPLEKLRADIFSRVNALGIGAQGLGGLTTVLDVKIRTLPTHAASLPVALIPNCAADRHVTFTLDGAGPAVFEAPDAGDWPQIVLDRAAGAATRVDLNTLTRQVVRQWRVGETLLLSGGLLAARDAAHKRLATLSASGKSLPVSLAGRSIYYMGPVDPVRDEVIGPAGPTTASRFDSFMELMLGHGVLATIGKGERGAAAIDTIRRHGAASLVAVGGAAYLLSKAIRSSRVSAFPDLGMEAIRELEVSELPVIVAVDSRGRSIHEEGPAQWREQVLSRRPGA